MPSLPEMEEKALLRRRYREIRGSLGEEREDYSQSICMAAESLPLFKEADAIFLYSAKGSEADLASLCRTALAAGKRVAYPRVLSKGQMKFFEITSLSELGEGSFGVMEPPEREKEAEVTKSTVAFVPALAFDSGGYRLGYGGGYYDRFLSGFEGISVGIAYEACLCESLLREEHDQRVDYIITESQVKEI